MDYSERYASYGRKPVVCKWVYESDKPAHGCRHYETSCRNGVDVGDGDKVPEVCPHCGEWVREIRP